MKTAHENTAMNDITTAWLFPGQGSQAVGMGRDLFASYAPARELLAAASDMVEVDLAKIIARGPDALLARTDILQPALTVMNLACCLLLQESGVAVDVTAGHSLGEFSALFAAGVLDLHDTLRVVVARAQLMHQVSSTLDGGMLAVKDLDIEIIETIIADIGRTHAVCIANYNTPNQTAISGDQDGLAKAGAALASRGARIIPLNVSGPWHSPLLTPAAQRFVEVLRGVAFHDARVPIVMNVSGNALSAAAEIRAMLEQQLCSPVLWVPVLRTLHELGVKRCIEVGPGTVLRGLLRGAPDLATCAVVNFDGPKALRFLAIAEKIE